MESISSPTRLRRRTTSCTSSPAPPGRTSSRSDPTLRSSSQDPSNWVFISVLYIMKNSYHSERQRASFGLLEKRGPETLVAWETLIRKTGSFEPNPSTAHSPEPKSRSGSQFPHKMVRSLKQLAANAAAESIRSAALGQCTPASKRPTRKTTRAPFFFCLRLPRSKFQAEKKVYDPFLQLRFRPSGSFYSTPTRTPGLSSGAPARIRI